MPWEKTGTVSIAQHSSSVIGTGTLFIANGRVGDAFRAPDGAWYEVVNIASEGALSIAPPYQGVTVSGGDYALAPMQGYVKESADQLRTVANAVGSKFADLGTTGNYDTLPINKGGTGATTPADARVALGLATTDGLPEGASLYFTAPRVLSTVLAGLATAGNVVVTAADSILAAIAKLQGQVAARALKGANADITSLTGLKTAITVGQGGTGATDQATALANLGGQPKRASLSALSFDTFAADQAPYFNGTASTALMTVTPFIRTVLDDTSAAQACDTLGLTSGLYPPRFSTIRAGGSNVGIGSGQGTHMGWNDSNGQGEASFVCNKGGGTGGFTWRTVNFENTATGPTMTYSYAGNLAVPGTLTQGSDRRLKINDVEITGGLEKVLAVRPVEFDRRASLADEQYPFHESGFIAQELDEVLPILVSRPDDQLGGEVWRVNYTGLIPYLVSAIKELKAELDQVKAGAQ